jgi:outer membrane protein OmpA-like peptidoglycan-associated protein
MAKILPCFFFVFFSFLAKVTSQTKIVISNKSFEDIPRKGDQFFSVAGWYDCGPINFPKESPPDVHPGNYWNNNTPPSNGNTYLGMVVRDNESYEGISQRLAVPLKVGKCYKFTIDLSRSNSYISKSTLTYKETNYITPAVFRIWGGSGMCNEMELLGESAAINHFEWKTYQFKVKPKIAHRFIIIQAYWKVPVITPYCGHVLIDNLTDFEEMDCNAVLPAIAPKKGDAAIADAKKDALPPHKRGRVENSKEKPKEKPKDSVVAAPPKAKILDELDINKIKTGSTIEVKKLYFKADTTTIDKNSYEVLNEIYGFLKEHDKIRVEIGGHTNGIPSHEYCDKLSAARAKVVHDYLVSKGINESRLTFKGYGKRRKIAADSTVEGRTKNQRVELKILSVG